MPFPMSFQVDRIHWGNECDLPEMEFELVLSIPFFMIIIIRPMLHLPNYFEKFAKNDKLFQLIF